VEEEREIVMQFQSSQPDPPSSRPPKNKVDRFISEFFDTLDSIGNRIFGAWWMFIYESVQDAIALSILVRLPNLLSNWLIGKDFSSFDVCMQTGNWLGTERYACFIVVIADFTGWILLAGRIAQRFICSLAMLNSKGASYAKK
jgi:hypothetical protein